jgi:hypothetical protein
MNTTAKYLSFAFAFFLLPLTLALGQTDIKTVYLKDGTTIQGKVVAQDDSTLVLETQYGTLEIRRANILKQELAKQLPAEPKASEAQIIYLKDGTTVIGFVTLEGPDSLSVETGYGSIKIPKSSVSHIGSKLHPQREKSSPERELPRETRAPQTAETEEVFAQVQVPEEYPAKEGFFLGVIIPYSGISGDFTGEQALVVPDKGELFAVPDVKGSFGIGILLGGRFHRPAEFAVELSYIWSKHDISFLGAKGKANYKIVNLDYKFYVSSEKQIQPYLLLGWCIPWLVVEDGAVQVYSSGTSSVGDATFITAFGGFNLGGGLEYYIYPRVSLSAGVLYRFIEYNRVAGVSGEDRLMKDNLKGSGVNFALAMKATF